MKKDERLNASVKGANSLGYLFFWYGIFAVLLYRWFILDQSLIDTLDLFAVWIVASLVQFISLALKGVPLTYPIKFHKKELKYYIFLVPIIAGISSVLILFFFRDVNEIRRLFGGFVLSAFGTFILLFVYRIIIYFWEKQNI